MAIIAASADLTWEIRFMQINNVNCSSCCCTYTNKVTYYAYYPIVVAGVSALCSVIVTVFAVSAEKLSTLAPQCIDAALQVDVESRVVVDRQWSLRWQVGVGGIHLSLEAVVVDPQESGEIDKRLGYQRLAQQCAIQAILGSIIKKKKNVFNLKWKCESEKLLRQFVQLYVQKWLSSFLPLVYRSATTSIAFAYLSANVIYILWISEAQIRVSLFKDRRGMKPLARYVNKCSSTKWFDI